jgi:hypothetical protein
MIDEQRAGGDEGGYSCWEDPWLEDRDPRELWDNPCDDGMIRHGVDYGQPIYPVRAIIGDRDTHLTLLVAEAGEEEALAAFTRQACALLTNAFPGRWFDIVLWGEADDPGLYCFGEMAAEIVQPALRITYDICRLRLCRDR